MAFLGMRKKVSVQSKNKKKLKFEKKFGFIEKFLLNSIKISISLSLKNKNKFKDLGISNIKIKKLFKFKRVVNFTNVTILNIEN